MNFYAFAKWLVTLLLQTFWHFQVEGAEHVPPDGPLIVACNHRSYFDPPALGCALPRPVAYMAKIELFRIPVLGSIITWLNAFSVDRSRGDVAAIKKAVEQLRQGKAVGIFPEGTRNLTGEVKAQVGVALLASLSKAPVLPAYVSGTAHAHRFAPIRVAFGEPVVLASGGKATREDLAKWTDEVMARIEALREKLGDH